MKSLSDIHTFFLITIGTIIILNFSFLGFFGLIIYGLLIGYSLLFFAYNIRRQKMLQIPMLYVLIAYYLYFLLAVCINGSVIVNGAAILQLFLFSLIAFFVRDSKDLIKDITAIAKMMIIAGIFMSLGSLLIALLCHTNPDLINDLPSKIGAFLVKVTGDFPRRLTGLNNNPNGTAEFCTVSTIMSIFILTFERKTKWVVLSLINIICSLNLIVLWTNSRTNMAALFAFTMAYFIIFFFISNNENKSLKKIAIIIITVVVICTLIMTAIILTSQTLRDFILERVLRSSSLKTASGRDSVYRVAVELGEGHRLFGYNISELAQRIAPHAHNMFLQLLSFAGVPGLVLFSIYFLYTSYVAIKNLLNKTFSQEIKNFNCFLACYIFYFFVEGIPETAGVDSMRMSSILLQLVLAYTYIIYFQNKREKNN